MNIKTNYILFVIPLIVCLTITCHETSESVPFYIDKINADYNYTTDCENNFAHLFDGRDSTHWFGCGFPNESVNLSMSFRTDTLVKRLLIKTDKQSFNSNSTEIELFINNHNFGIIKPCDTIDINLKIRQLSFKFREKVATVKPIRVYIENNDSIEFAGIEISDQQEPFGISEIELFDMQNYKIEIIAPESLKPKITADSTNANSFDEITKSRHLNPIINRKIVAYSSIDLKEYYFIKLFDDFTFQYVSSKKDLYCNSLGNWQIIKYNDSETLIRLLGYVDNEARIPFHDTLVITENEIVTLAASQRMLLKPPPNSFVNVSDITDNISIDLKYAGTDNFAKQQFYPCQTCVLRYLIIIELMKATALFKSHGYRIKLWDCYRPLSIQEKMWEFFPNPVFVADPRGFGSAHNRGGAIDMTLIDSTGRELDMGTGFDYFGPKAFPSCKALPDSILANRQLLISTMLSLGFFNSRSEWWHFSHPETYNFNKSNFALPCE